MILKIRGWLLLLLVLSTMHVLAQDPVAVEGTDSTYVLRHFLRNDIRIFYGFQANSVNYGSVNDGSPDWSGDLYKNFNDFIGVGITYKWLDGNLTFSLPGTTYLNQERSTLDKFTLGLNATGRKFAFRGYLRDTKGVIATSPDPDFESAPSLHEFKIIAQVTTIFNEKKYSYRAALYQSELQQKTSASWMLRADIFYRQLGAKEQFLQPPYDNASRFADQVGLHYVGAPGVMVLPGYGANFSWKKGSLFLSPMIFGGAGVAFNSIKGDRGTFHKTNLEWNGSFLLNAGYNGNRMYCKIQSSVSIGYAKLDPAYLMTKDFDIIFLIGYRFRDMESWIPREPHP